MPPLAELPSAAPQMRPDSGSPVGPVANPILSLAGSAVGERLVGRDDGGILTSPSAPPASGPRGYLG